MKFEAASMAELADILAGRGKQAELQREKEKTERGRRYFRGEANAYADAASLVRDTVIKPKAPKCLSCRKLGQANCPVHSKGEAQ